MEYDAPGESDTETLPDTDPIAKWSVKTNSSTPPPSRIRKIHIYDFDNTLFRSPAPNPELWDRQTLWLLKEARSINNSSWWQKPEFLKQAGNGYEREKANGWNGLWIERLVKLLRQSGSDPSILTIIMTGRKANCFADLMLEMLQSKGLEYDCLILKKGQYRNTLKYKIQVLADFSSAYPGIEELVMYDDRPDQLRGFREYFRKARPKFRYTLNSIKPQSSMLPPETEVDIVKRWVASHNHNYKTGKVRNLGLLELGKGERYFITRTSN